jgi:AraC-like DNA-binding protein
MRRYLVEEVRLVRAFRHDCVALCPLHAHETCEIILHLGASGSEWVRGGQPREFVSGGITVIPAGLEHAQRTLGPGEDICLHLPSPRSLPRELESPIMVPAAGDILLQQLVLELSRPAAEGELQSLMRDQLLRCVVGRILALASQDADASDHVGQAQRLIAERFRDLQSLKEIAGALKLSADHLRHVFKRSTGRSMMEHLTMVRMAHARELLEHTSLPIAEIASQCGYASHRRFGSVFRDTYASTATTFRRRQ